MEARKSLEVPEFIFANWLEVLNQVPLSVSIRRSYVQAMEKYLDYCRNNGVSVGQETARCFIGDVLRRGLTRETEAWREGLLVFHRRAQTRAERSGQGGRIARLALRR